MKRITLNAIVDIFCLIMFIPSLITGLVLYIALPSGGGRGNSLSMYMGVTRADWLNMHNISSLVFAALLILHLLLHVKFFRNIGKHLKPNANTPEPCET